MNEDDNDYYEEIIRQPGLIGWVKYAFANVRYYLNYAVMLVHKLDELMYAAMFFAFIYVVYKHFVG